MDKKSRNKVPGSGKKAGKKINQLTDADYLRYTNIVIELITVKCMPKLQIAKMLAIEGLGPHQIRETLRRANDTITSFYDSSTELTLERAIGQLQEMMLEALKQGEIKTALDVRKELNKLGGLHTQKVELSGSVTIPSIIEIVKVKKNDNE